MDAEWKSTEPFYLEGSGSSRRVSIMIIHGFTGNPGDCRRLGRYLQHEGYNVQAIRLPGHGTTPEAMKDTRWEDWWQHTLASYDDLVMMTPSKLVIPVGFSMGGLLALKLSLHRPVAGVVSLAAPIYLQDRRVWLAGLVKHVKPYIHKQPAISEYLAMERCAYAKTPLACVESLYKHIRIMKRKLSEVNAPLFIGQGLADRTVRPESASYIYHAVSSKHKMLRYYPDSSHAIMADIRRAEVYRDVAQFVYDVKEAASAGEHDSACEAIEGVGYASTLFGASREVDICLTNDGSRMSGR